MGWYLTAGIGTLGNYPSQNYTKFQYSIRLNWNNSDTFYGFSSSASGNIAYSIGAGTVNVPISVSAPSSAGTGASSGYVTLASGTLDISHNVTGGIASVTISGSYANSHVGTLSDDDYVGDLQEYDRRPATPSSISGTVNANKTITANIAEITAPGGTPAITTTYNAQYSVDGGAYTGTQSGSGTSYTFSGLTPGKTYTFRAYTNNADGQSTGFAYSSPVFLPSGGKRYDGSSYIATQTAKRYDGSTWQTIVTAKRYDGSSWVNLS